MRSCSSGWFHMSYTSTCKELAGSPQSFTVVLYQTSPVLVLVVKTFLELWNHATYHLPSPVSPSGCTKVIRLGTVKSEAIILTPELCVTSYSLSQWVLLTAIHLPMTDIWVSFLVFLLPYLPTPEPKRLVSTSSLLALSLLLSHCHSLLRGLPPPLLPLPSQPHSVHCSQNNVSEMLIWSSHSLLKSLQYLLTAFRIKSNSFPW